MSHFNAVKDFMKACDQEVKEYTSVPNIETVRLRMKLIVEELSELLEAVWFPNNSQIQGHLAEVDQLIDAAYSCDPSMVDITDALTDLEYVILGAGHSFGLNLDRAFNIVHDSNMSKVNKETGKVTKNEYGKVMKPKTWIPPDLKSCIIEMEEQNILDNLAIQDYKKTLL